MGEYKMVVMRPDVSVGIVTAGGLIEPREDWTNQARANLLAALEKQQAARGGQTRIASSTNDAGADAALVADLNKLHDAVGRAIEIHKYTSGAELPTKKGLFDWTLGDKAVEYGRISGSDYALFLHASDTFSSGGRIALQAVSMLGCGFGLCVVPLGGMQSAFASLVDLRTGQIVWFNHLGSAVGDIREQEGADHMVEKLLDSMKPFKPQAPEPPRSGG
jgi:hypothetical protein